MKKIFAVFLSVLFVMSAASLLVSAGPITQDSRDIDCLDFLDFSADTSYLWAKYNEETGEWEQNEGPDDYGDIKVINGSNYNQPIDENGTPIAPALHIYEDYLENTSWSITENGEVFHFEVTGDNPYPGVGFVVDEYRENNMRIGGESESTPKAEYVKIRVRNYSSASRFTVGYITNSTNQGRFVLATISDLMEDKNGKSYISGSGEWETYIFSMKDINRATNYEELLPLDSDGNVSDRWGGQLLEFLIFPFGYEVDNGTGAYPGAAIDIDYIVIGSEEFVTNYKSELELKEESITNLELVSAPTKTSYYVGETLDLDGLQLRATYNDGTTEILDSVSSSANLNTASESTPVTLSFGPHSVSYNISVTGITNLEVIEQPDSLEYELSTLTDGFTPEGFKFQVTYADGTVNSEITESMCRYTGDVSSVGQKTITANYYGLTTSFDIEIIDVVGLEIESPEKVYRYNDTLTESDFTIYYLYNNGTTKLHEDDETDTTLDITVTCNTKTPGEVMATVTGVDDTRDLTFTTEVPVQVEAPVAMRVTRDPTTTTYAVGDSFSTTGMTVVFVYEDESTVTISADDYRPRYDFNSPGEKEVRIISAVEGIDLETTVTVNVDGSAITTNPPSLSQTTTGSSDNDGPSIGLIIGIVAAVVVVVVVVIVIVVVSKKKKKDDAEK